MDKEILSWAALENCHYDVMELKANITCFKCGAQIHEAGFFGYKKASVSWLQHLSGENSKEILLISNYQFLHMNCDHLD